MSIKFKCDTCGKSYAVPDNLAGKQGKCRCGTTIKIQGCSSTNPSRAIASQKPALTWDDEIQKTERRPLNTLDGEKTYLSPASSRKPTKSGNGGAFAFVGIALCLLFLLFRGCAPSDNTSANNHSSYTSPNKYNDYKSTKPTWQMDGQEKHELNEAWGKMSQEEKKKQIRRDFGDLD
jgi:hypothetical protein